MKLNINNSIFLIKTYGNQTTNNKFWRAFENDVTWQGCKITATYFIYLSQPNIHHNNSEVCFGPFHHPFVGHSI